jgi:RES domain
VIHDPAILDRLDALPKEAFDGQVYRAARLSLDPLAGSYNGGWWMARDVAAILYTSLGREGALAEIALHWSQLNPRPTKPVLVHRLRVVAHRTLRLIRADLSALGVPDAEYRGVNLPRTQAIGAAVEFLGCDGLIAPSARWDCENLMLFPERMGADATLELVNSEAVDWFAWGTAQGLIGSE